MRDSEYTMQDIESGVFEMDTQEIDRLVLLEGQVAYLETTVEMLIGHMAVLYTLLDAALPAHRGKLLVYSASANTYVPLPYDIQDLYKMFRASAQHAKGRLRGE